ncbi:CubicO group peptidase (beta-lactamase class C family) [Salirhabdus euzebyi]|uniref:CubicO group peptidase (Beta-lactamase class C family) n=1 Tax=Salirhabdus euzebyi TaxID=394506 RepID=A0A841PS04_9BACI|nr:serine hydrolase domain-containing protein [Salirhabdus euzebyi]MBB6451707.1 CubicO group peptidase (beta-lactamase class C family) [Salirhabdus euzebyi]
MNSMEEKIDYLFDKYLQEKCFAGGVCFIKHKDKNVFVKAYGKRNRVTNEDVNVDTIFDLASVTKIFTSTVILKMVSDEKLTLETTLGECLPRVAGHNVLAPITIKQLLTHSSGLQAWFPFYTYLSDDLFSLLKKLDLVHQEQNEVVYSDLNYILLGEVIKHHYNASLQDVLQQEMVTPLKMKQVTYGSISSLNVAATEFGNQIEMQMCHSRNRDFPDWRNTNEPIVGEVNDGNTYYFFKGQSGHAGIFGTAEDLSKLVDVYSKGGMSENKRFITTNLVQQSMQNVVEDRGLGWHSSEPFPEGFGHTGFTGTAIWIVPEKDLQVILLTNRLHVDQPKNINPFRKELYEEVLNYFS